MKRLVDISGALIGLALLSPIFLVISCLQFFFEGLPLFFSQKRVGQHKKEFQLYKFRSMKVRENANDGPLITAKGDTRITLLGSFLRKTKLDELPQLWNVLRGDMSLVGPRPEVSRYTSLYDEAEREILNLRPGITDPASIELYDEEHLLAKADDAELYYQTVLLPQKIRISLAYAKRATLWDDLLIIGKTVTRILVKQNECDKPDIMQILKDKKGINQKAA